MGERTPETRRRKELSDWWRVRQWRGQDGRINCRFGVNSHVSPASTRAGISPRRRGSAGRGINSRRFFLIVARQPKMSGETSALFLRHTHTHTHSVTDTHTHAHFCFVVVFRRLWETNETNGGRSVLPNWPGRYQTSKTCNYLNLPGSKVKP